MSYEPPTVPLGTPAALGSEPLLWPGVQGYAIEHNGRIYIPMIFAQRPGSGDVGRFLDALSPRCCIVAVASDRLAGMLRRRGWQLTTEMLPDPDGDGLCEVWVHPSAEARRC